MQYPPEVERWRSTVAKYFRPEDVDKALWVIQHESGGNPGAVGDGGAARGLFQIQDSRNFANRPGAEYLDNPENNIRYAAQELGAGSGNWGAWGEGTSYNGKPFGALGNNPYPGSNASTSGGYPSAPSTGSGGTMYDENRYNELVTAAQQALDDWDEGGRDPDEYEKLVVPAMTAVASYRELYGIDPRKDGSADANDAVSRWATVEGVDIDRAQQAYQNWKATNDLAFSAADAEISSFNGQVEQAAAMQEARNKSSTPGLMPRNVYGGANAPDYEKTLGRWKTKFGATDTPPATSGYTTGPSITGAAPTMPASSGVDTRQTTLRPGQNPIDDILGYAPGGDPRNENPPEGIQPGATSTRAPSYAKKDGFGFDDVLDVTSMIPGPLGVPGRSVNQAKAVGKGVKKVGKWFTRKFAEGGENIPGGPAWVGEKGPEIMIDALGNQTIVGRDGPEQIVIPEGSTIIPAGEAFAMKNIKRGMGQPFDDGAMARQNDPDIATKAMESARRAIGASYAMNPPSTPVPYGGAVDRFAPWRQLTGVQVPVEGETRAAS